MRAPAVLRPVLAVVLLLGALTVAGCGGGGPDGPEPVASVFVSAPTSNPVVGATVALSALIRDAKGNTLSGRSVTWSSSAPTIAAVDNSGILTALAPGTASITATSEGQAATIGVTVLPIPVASVRFSVDFATLIVGNSQTVSATITGANGATLFDRPLTWASDNPSVAQVDQGGVVTAIAPGSARVTASAEGKSALVNVTVTARGDGPSIATIMPAALSGGATATIIGSNFDATAANNTVLVRGVRANVLSASATQLTVEIPCVERGTAPISVTARGLTAAAVDRTIDVPQRTLAVGQSLILTASAASICNELTTASPTARYLVAVFSASTSPNVVADFELRGNTPPPGSTALAAAPFALIREPVPAGVDPERAREVARDAKHFEHLERDRADYARLHGLASRTPVAAAMRAADLPEVGAMRSLFYTFNATCADTTRVIRGKAIYVGTRSIIWEDSTNALQSDTSATLATYYRRLGQIFDTDQYESIRKNFGDPLLRDAVTDADGRVHMVFTNRLNNSGAAAFVTGCDQYPRSGATIGSNVGQFFYGMVPTTATAGFSSTSSADGWFYFMARTVVHEVKHIASISARVANNAPTGEESWLEEGTARHAEELWVRESLHRTAWKSNLGFGTAATNGLFCDFSPADAACQQADPLRRPSYGMRRHFDEILPKLVQPWNYSPYGDGTGQSGSTFYQTAWSLVRYAIDRYATSDADFFKRLINAQTSGVTNLVSVTGASIDQLVGGWGLALVADDYPGLVAPNADIQFPSWNLRNIYASLNTLPGFTTRYTTPFPIQPAALGFGQFTQRVTGMRGGAHAYFEISGASSPTQLLNIRASGGGVPSTGLRIAIARLQ